MCFTTPGKGYTTATWMRPGYWFVNIILRSRKKGTILIPGGFGQPSQPRVSMRNVAFLRSFGFTTDSKTFAMASECFSSPMFLSYRGPCRKSRGLPSRATPVARMNFAETARAASAICSGLPGPRRHFRCASYISQAAAALCRRTLAKRSSSAAAAWGKRALKAPRTFSSSGPDGTTLPAIPFNRTGCGAARDFLAARRPGLLVPLR
mmetsp:Transcript_39244/g.109172  ORF Transcript_39244/g.109172 Transcript_39244/m.109172 type:complete len:207 (-) Transcript_39244:39-659(-)